ncbi:cell division protein FtsA [Candidatus Saccharibacteria bacterium CPR2]|nr:cell division protein FtsA [Candidatus Saccharibacteria bacterium CPR2]
MHRQAQYFVGIDVGSNNTRCVIGFSDNDDMIPSIVGVGESPSVGMRKGNIVEVNEVVQSIDSAIAEAERSSGLKLPGTTIGVNGTHILSMSSKGVIAVSSGSREITADEIARAEEAATVVQLPANREIIQVFPKKYRLDGQDNIKDPTGMSGVRLEIDAQVVTASIPALRNLDKVFNNLQLQIHQHVLNGVAAAEAVLSRPQKENGVALIDIGGGTTNVAVFEEGDLQHAAVLPVGGNNITNDLAIGLRTDLDIAEKVKIKHGTAKYDDTKRDREIHFGQGKSQHIFDGEEIEMIIQARLDEIFELVEEELDKVDRKGKLPGGVVLVGGGAKLTNIDEYAKEKLRLPARVQKPKGFSGLSDRVDDPSFSTVIGLMLYDAHSIGGGRQKGWMINAGKSGISGASKVLKQIFHRLKP